MKLFFTNILKSLYLSTFCQNIITPYIIYDKSISRREIEKAYALLNLSSINLNNSCICKNQITSNTNIDLQIIVPAYNVERYIKECIDSIIDQETKYHCEIYIVNDGSLDKTREILKQYENHPNIKIIDQRNKGLSGARNKALEFINAKYILFVDSDDKLVPNSINKLMDQAYSHNADIVEGNYSIFDDKKGKKLFINKHSYNINATQNELFGFAWGKIYKSSLFRNLHFPEGYWFEDTICSFIIGSLCNKIVTLSDDIYLYRINENGITNTANKNIKIIDTLWVSKRLLEDAQLLGIKNDSTLYNIFLRQVQTNFKRIHTLKNSQIEKAVFYVTVDLFNKYFKQQTTNDPNLISLERALRNNHFRIYKLQCRLS